MPPSASLLAPLSPRRPWSSLLADLVLAGLVSGPPAAPFLAAAGLPLLPEIAKIIYFMGVHVCPQPEMGLMLMPPYLMAVCLRCYGTVLGLLFTRLLYHRTQGRGAYWLHAYGVWGLLLTILLCLFYPAELLIQRWGGWGYHHWVVFPFGWVSGVGLGAYIMPLLHGKSGQLARHSGG